MPYDPTTDPADLEACRRLLEDGSRSFLAASRLLPPDIAQGAWSLYAFCRIADDRVDRDARGGAIEDLHERLERVYRGAPREDAVDRSFAAFVARHALPRAWPLALFEGFAWDAQGRPYEDISALRAYAARVAGSVGAMMARAMGVSDRAVLARACELGVAMQLTNIARDVGEDALAGRLYLPRDWMREAGLDPDAWLARPGYSPALASVVRRLLEEADRRYRGAVLGIGSLPLLCRPGIRAAALLYCEIGRVIERDGFDSCSRRAVVARRRKLPLLAGALLGAAPGGRGPLPPPPPEIDFLLESAGPLPAAGSRETSVDTLIRIFDRLERRDRGLESASASGAGA